jgi:acylglycerol lipase
MPATPVTAWAPPGSPRAVIVALHGFNDHKAAFAEFGAHAAARGVVVEAYDQPGFGERADRGRWAGTEALVLELHAAVRSARARHPGAPVFVLGESMGAAVALVALARPEAPAVDGLVLAAPAVWNGDGLPRGYRTALRLLAALVPPFRVSGRNLDVQASDNIEMLRALGRDPLYLRETRIDAVAGLVDLMDEAREGAPRQRLPMLVLLGARDEIVPPQASRTFVRTLDPGSCSVVAYLDGWHLLLRDHQRERVFRDVVAWVGGEPLPSRLDYPCGPPPAF